MERLTVILSPHFDDAILSLGGLLAKKGTAAKVLTFFSGKPAKPRLSLWDVVCGFSNSTKAVDARSKENDNALAFLGLSSSSVINLGYLEQSYRSAKDEKNLEGLLLIDLLKFLEEYTDREIDIYAPSLELHRDHALIKHTLLAAIPHLQSRSAAFFLYQDIPYAYSTPFLSLSKKEAGAYQVEPTPLPVSQDEMTKKIAAIKLYTSQTFPLALTSGGPLSSRIKDFAAKQARKFHVPTTYCEMVYRLLVTS